jgi:osmotically inducible protein OsmC
VRRDLAAMAAIRTAEAEWSGDLLRGQGTVKGASGALPQLAVSWAARTEQPGGKTSPEELLAAANASCFSMALSGALGRMQKPPENLHVTAQATFDKVGEGWKVVSMNLSVTGKVPGITAQQFEEAAKTAGKNCPISQALQNNVAIQVTAKLVP